MKSYADQERHVKPNHLSAGDITLVRQRRFTKSSPHFEHVPYTVLDVKGSMITARRAIDRKEVTRNSSHFKKLTNPPGSTVLDTESVPVDEQVPLDFERRSVNLPRPQHPKRNLVRHTQAKLTVTKTTQRLQQQSNLPFHYLYSPAVVD